ncbi:MAG: glycosyltransferase family 2 protein [bacterium]|nr:glycosyltransferase family 2 protein [bacterium]
MQLSVIIVNFNNDRVLRGCLQSLPPALEGLDVEVILSDNGSSDGSLQWTREKFPEIQILENGDNIGFAEANNRALAIAHGRYILLLNPDTIVRPESFRTMIELLDRETSAGAVGCKLVETNGDRQISARSYPTLTTYLYHFLGLEDRFPRSPRFGRFHMSYWEGDDARPVDWVCGASLMIRRELLDSVGGIDPYFFLTYDEVDWCHRIQDAGHEIWYTPDTEITHLVGQSDPQSNPNPDSKIKYMTVERNSRVHYFIRHHGRFYATLVEALHIASNAALLLKARVFGTNQSTETMLERRLFLKLYWRTAMRIPRAGLSALLRRFGRDANYAILSNPYLEGQEPMPAQVSPQSPSK